METIVCYSESIRITGSVRTERGMACSRLRYEPIPPWSRQAVEQALGGGDPLALTIAVLAVSLHDPDWAYAQSVCVRLSTHPHHNVRGNAVLGLGHIARVHQRLDQTIAWPIIQRALGDEDEYVRGHADAAADDTEIFLGWKYVR